MRITSTHFTEIGYCISEEKMAVLLKSCLLAVLLVSSACGVEIVSRAGWGASSPKSTSTMTTPVSTVFIHHTAGTRCYSKSACINVVKGIQNYHMKNKGWDDIGYSFLVGEDGRAYEGRGWTRTGAHTYGYNKKSIAISFMGNFMTATPSQNAINAARGLITLGKQLGYLRSNTCVRGHRDVSSTDCPGNKLYQKIQTWSDYC